MTDTTVVADVDIDGNIRNATKRAWEGIEIVRDAAREARIEAVRVESEIEALGEALGAGTEDATWIALRDAAIRSTAEAMIAETAVETGAQAIRDAYMAAGDIVDIVWCARQEAS